MGFIDELKRLARPYEDEEMDDFDDFEPVGRASVVREKARDREVSNTVYQRRGSSYFCATGLSACISLLPLLLTSS